MEFQVSSPSESLTADFKAGSDFCSPSALPGANSPRLDVRERH